MKKIDRRDLPNMQTSQDLIRRYDLSALDHISSKSSTDAAVQIDASGNDAAVGIGMEPTVDAGLQSKDGFYNGDGLKQPTAKNIQNINLDTLIIPGMYRVDLAINKPSDANNWSQVLVIYGGSDTIAQMYFDYATNRMWVRTAFGIGSTPNWRSWKRVLTSEMPRYLGAVASNIPMAAGGFVNIPFTAIYDVGSFYYDGLQFMPTENGLYQINVTLALVNASATPYRTFCEIQVPYPNGSSYPSHMRSQDHYIYNNADMTLTLSEQGYFTAGSVFYIRAYTAMPGQYISTGTHISVAKIGE